MKFAEVEPIEKPLIKHGGSDASVSERSKNSEGGDTTASIDTAAIFEHESLELFSDWAGSLSNAWVGAFPGVPWSIVPTGEALSYSEEGALQLSYDS